MRSNRGHPVYARALKLNLARDYATIVYGISDFNARNDAGTIDEIDYQFLERTKKSFRKFKEKYGEDFFNKYFKRWLSERDLLSLLSIEEDEE